MEQQAAKLSLGVDAFAAGNLSKIAIHDLHITVRVVQIRRQSEMAP